MTTPKRRDADRRSRQCAKFARLIRIARLVMGNGRWAAEDLAKEVECSLRTVYRDVETLSAAGVPIIFDKGIQAYKVREGFRFSGLDPIEIGPQDEAIPNTHDLLVRTRRVLKEAEGLMIALRQLCAQLEGKNST